MPRLSFNFEPSKGPSDSLNPVPAPSKFGPKLIASRAIVNHIVSNITTTTGGQPASRTYNINCSCSGPPEGPGTECALCTTEVSRNPESQSTKKGIYYPGRDLNLTSEDRRMLSKLLTVNKAFFQPSLNMLWRTQASLVPLIMCLPDDAYEVGEGGEVHITRALDGCRDFVRINFYSHRIKHFISLHPLSFTYQKAKTIHISLPTALSLLQSILNPFLPRVHTLVIPSETLIQLRPHLFHSDVLRSVTLLVTSSEQANTTTRSITETAREPATFSWFSIISLLPLSRLEHFGITLFPHSEPSEPDKKDRNRLSDAERTIQRLADDEIALAKFLRAFFPPSSPIDDKIPSAQSPMPSLDMELPILPIPPPAAKQFSHLTCLSLPNVTIPTRSLFFLATTPTATCPVVSGIKSLDVRVLPRQLDDVLKLWDTEHEDYPRVRCWEKGGKGVYRMHLFQGLEWLRLGVTALGELQRFLEKWSSEERSVSLIGLSIWRWCESDHRGENARRDWDYTTFITALYRHLDRGTLRHLSIIDETTIKSKALRIRSTFSPSLWTYLLQFHNMTTFEICSPSLSLYLSTGPSVSSTLAASTPPPPPASRVTIQNNEGPVTREVTCCCFTFRSERSRSGRKSKIRSLFSRSPKEEEKPQEVEWIPQDPRNLVPTLTPCILIRISHAWPNLTFFGWRSYDCVYESPPGGMVTLRELVDFVGRCKYLRGLEIRFDARCGTWPVGGKVPEPGKGFAREEESRREGQGERRPLAVGLPRNFSRRSTAQPVILALNDPNKSDDVVKYLSKLSKDTKQKLRPLDRLLSAPYLEYLNVCTSPIGPGPELSFGRGRGRRKDNSPWIVAAILRMAFPNLKRLDFGGPMEHEDGFGDGEVDEGDEFLPITESPTSSRRRWVIVKELLNL